MRTLSAILLAIALLVPEIGAAQSGSVVAPRVGDSITTSTTAVTKKKKGGMFGKVKGLAKNKIVKTVAKTALCTAVPGGQVIAGALDAAETKDVAGAATTAATGGGSCMPGMAGRGAPTGPGAAGIEAAGVGALGAGVAGAGLPGQPSTGMPGMAMSPEQLKQMQEQYGKMGMDTAQLRAMQQMMGAMPGAAQPEAAAAAEPGPASGAPALSREKGRLLVRRLPWVPGSEALQPGGEPRFGMAMQEIRTEIQATTKRYKIEARVEDQGGKSESRKLARKRAEAVLAALSARGVPAERLAVSDGGSDKDPRIIVSESK
jgi:hypothetical protein